MAGTTRARTEGLDSTKRATQGGDLEHAQQLGKTHKAFHHGSIGCATLDDFDFMNMHRNRETFRCRGGGSRRRESFSVHTFIVVSRTT
jgi:hypothetical protein